jgi:hypothetical protein
VVDAEVARRLLQQNPADAWRRVDRVRVGHDDKRAEPVVFDQVDAARKPVDTRVVPCDRERNRGIEQHAKVVSVVGVFIELPEVQDDPAAESLLGAKLDLIAPTRRHRSPPPKSPLEAVAGRQQQVLAVRRSIVRPHDACSTVALRETARHAKPAGGASRRQAIVVIEPEAELERGIARLDVILTLRRLLL